MYTSLTRHATDSGPRWAVDGRYLPTDFRLSQLLRQRAVDLPAALAQLPRSEPAQDPLLAPLEPEHEVWASGVTYLSSRMAREAESSSKDVYQKVYAAERPELFFKACGWRVVGHGERIRIRADSAWNVPEPELTLVLNRHGEIVGYTVGNDVSSRSIEGENPLYLPQAKVYDGSCALGPAIRLCGADSLRRLPISLEIHREQQLAFSGRTGTDQIKRQLEELAGYLFRELAFPQGAFLLTGTGIVPGEDFSLAAGDRVCINIDGMTLENQVQ